jgi:hypothetical protein
MFKHLLVKQVFLFWLEGEDMQPNGKEKRQQLKKKKQQQENLSTKEWEEIMGVNRDTYTRKNGAIRRK